MSRIKLAIAALKVAAPRLRNALRRWANKRRRRRIAKTLLALVVACGLCGGCKTLDWLEWVDEKLPENDKTPPIVQVEEQPQQEQADPITITAWGKEPAGGAQIDPQAVVKVSSDGKVWSWDSEPTWKRYKLNSSRTYYAACYIAVPHGDGWKAGKFDHLPTDLNHRDHKNIHSGYAELPIPEHGATVYYFAVSNDKRHRSNLVKGEWR